MEKRDILNTKNNRRYKDNEIRMEAALMKLMKKKEFEKITVREICELADVNRTTFYAHFVDMQDMLDKMEDALRHELMARYQEKKDSRNQMFSPSSFYTFLQHIRKHQVFYRAALKSRRDFPLKQGYDEMLNQIIRPSCRRAGIESEEEIMYCFVSFQAGFTMVLRRWVEDGCRLDEKKLADIIVDCLPAVFIDSRKRIRKAIMQ